MAAHWAAVPLEEPHGDALGVEGMEARQVDGGHRPYADVLEALHAYGAMVRLGGGLHDGLGAGAHHRLGLTVHEGDLHRHLHREVVPAAAEPSVVVLPRAVAHERGGHVEGSIGDPVVRGDVDAQQLGHGGQHGVHGAPRLLVAEEEGGVVHVERLLALPGALVAVLCHGKATAREPA